MEFLVEHGADIIQENKWNGDTPLFMECESGNKDLVEYLVVKYGVNINQENKYGETPLF